MVNLLLINRGIEQEVFSMGMQTRSELNNIHSKEIKFFESSLEAAIKLMEEKHAEVSRFIHIMY